MIRYKTKGLYKQQTDEAVNGGRLKRTTRGSLEHCQMLTPRRH